MLKFGPLILLISSTVEKDKKKGMSLLCFMGFRLLVFVLKLILETLYSQSLSNFLLL
jgi:hypothetical protein